MAFLQSSLHYLCVYVCVYISIYTYIFVYIYRLPWWLRCKVSACNARHPGSILGLGRSPGGEHGNPLQYSCLENPMDKGAWWATVHGVAKSRTLLSV